MKVFSDYFKVEWLDKNRGWFEGFDPDGPSTNNGLESINGTLKKEHTFRRHEPLPEFLKTAPAIVEAWSTDRDSTMHDPEKHPKLFREQRVINTPAYRAAYDWVKKHRLTLKDEARDPSFIHFYTNAGGVEEEDEPTFKKTIEIYETALRRLKFKDFEQYHAILFKTWRTSFPKPLDSSTALLGRCTCPKFFKDHMCKHVIGIAATKKLVKIPNDAKSFLIRKKPARRRPAKAVKALSIQPADRVQEAATTSSTASTTSAAASIEKKGPGRPPKNKVTVPVESVALAASLKRKASVSSGSQSKRQK